MKGSKELLGEERTTKTKLIYNSIRHRILEGDLELGERLVIRSIASEFEVSDIPVREALIELAKDGFVENTPHSGMRVVDFALADVLDIIDIRQVMEPLASKLAANNMDADGIARMNHCYDDMKKYFESGQNDQYAKTNRAFHSIINEYSRNPRLISMLDRLYDLQRWMMIMFEISPEMVALSYKEHSLLIYYLSCRNAEAAEQLTYIHKKRYFDYLRKYCQEHDGIQKKYPKNSPRLARNDNK